MDKVNNIFKKIKISLLNLIKNWKFWIFLVLFTAMFGSFFNHKEQFANDKLLGQLYGNTVTNILGIVFLLVGWSLWEFAIGKRKSNLLAIFAFISFVIALGLIGNFLSFIGIGLALLIMIPVMIKILEPIDFEKLKKTIVKTKK